jgi:polar amino acid transport system substrate-binding protein
MVSEDGDISGISISLFHKIMKASAMSPQLEVVPWKRAFHIASVGEKDVLYPCAPLPERKEFFYFSDNVGQEEVVIATLIGTIHEGKYLTIEDLKGLGQNLAVSDRYATDSLLEQSGVSGYQTISRDSRFFPMIMRGRFKVYVGYRSVLNSFAAQESFDAKDKIHMQTVQTITYGFCVSKKSSKGIDIRNRLNSAIKDLKAKNL